MFRTTTASLTIAALALSACGSTQSGEQADDSKATETLPSIAALNAAFTEASGASAYRTTMSIGMNMDLGMLGQSMSFPADLATPLMTSESDADGEQRILMNLLPMMEAMLGDQPGDGTALFDELQMEIWQSDSTMIMDVGGIAPILQQMPGAADAFPAEVVSVDVDRLGDGFYGSDAASALTGQAAPDPAEMAAVLRDALGDAEQDADGQYSGTLTFIEYSKAFGQDPTAMLGGMDDSLEAIGGAEMMKALVAVFDDITVDVDVELDAAGSVDVVRYDMDMSPIWAALPELMASVEGAGEDGAMAEQFAGMFEDAVFEMTMLLDYDLDDSVEVTMPEGDFPDVTDQYLDMIATLPAT